MVFIVSCHEKSCKETEPEWTFTDLYSSLLISDEYKVIDIKISSDGKTEWVSVELLQPTELCVIVQKNHVQSGRVWKNLTSF